MKKVLLFIVMAAFITIVSHPQVSFGLKAGGNLYNFNGDDAGNSEGKIGYNLGGLLTISFSKYFSIQPEFLYSSVNTKRSVGSLDAVTCLSYFDIPLLFQYKRPDGFYAEAGPQIGFLTGAKVKFNGETENYKEAYKSTNFSLGLGLGYRFSYGIALGVRYCYGLSKIPESEPADIKLGGFQLAVSYKLKSILHK